MSVTPARRVAYTVIRRVFEDGAYADRALQGALGAAGLGPRDRAFATILSYGTVQRRRTLDHLIDSFSSRPVTRLDPGARAALELGMFQLALLDGVADHAAVHDSVALVKGESGGHGAARLVNAVLRAATAEARTRLAELDDATPARAAVLHSVPDWLADLFFDQFGPADARGLLAAANRPAESSVRINTLRPPGRPLDWAPAPPWAGPLTEGAPVLPEARILDGPVDLFGTPQWAAGEVIGQSRASMLVAATLDPQPGDRVLDLCAAPGAKTTHLAARMDGVGEIVAVEVHPGRAAALARTAERTGAVNVRVHVGDGANLGEIGSFDRVLVDPPCSGLGTLAARPDIRWQPRLERLDSLCERQTALLEAGAARTRPGGRLVYSVCTLHRAEAEAIVDAFLAAHPGWWQRSRRTTLPHVEGTDGFFVAELERA
ncbi:transcription antitermination factor NusB [Conexibacter sp. DBS9H8]|uniref:transcription antitermination factor NusB n=1 Tax=Conexibacter sp. DBS9H8 TaxID=2937801 RepID=UPI00200BC195|nr:transcription antitermination factor NusB [Conexibacter sp. DBS9H8]